MKLCLQFCWSIEQYETRPNISEIDHITEVYLPFPRADMKWQPLAQRAKKSLCVHLFF
jgi:hypothetical protein